MDSFSGTEGCTEEKMVIIDPGNPVFSIYQADIIYYGFDLTDYYFHEFGFELLKSFNATHEPRKIAFWSELVR